MRRLFRRLLHVTVVGSAFLFFWSGGTWLSWVWLPLLRLGGVTRRDPAEARRRAQEAVQRGFRFFCDVLRITRLIDVDPRRLVRHHDRPAVLTPNHPTLIDVVCLLAAYGHTCCVVKGSLWRSWTVGPLLRRAGHIDGSAGTAHILREGMERIAQGDSVLIFPEGTRSPAGSIHPFQRGAFEIAARSEVPVVPIAIRCSPPALMRGVPWHQVPDTFIEYTVTELAARRVPPGRPHVRATAEAVRATLLDRLQPSEPWDVAA